MRKICIGVDPDLHASGVAFIDFDTGALVGVAVCRGLKKNKGREACVDAACYARLFINKEMSFLDFFYNKPSWECKGAAVEGQEAVYAATHGAGPRPLILLAHVSGAWLASLCPIVNRLYLPAPAEWKGQTPKHIKQGRILASLGIEYDVHAPSNPYCVPKDPSKIPGGGEIKKTEWSEVIDAIGLAQWCREKIIKEKKQ